MSRNLYYIAIAFFGIRGVGSVYYLAHATGQAVVYAADERVFNHVGLCVHDLERSRRFYEELLGFSFEREITAPDEFTAPLLRLGDTSDDGEALLARSRRTANWNSSGVWSISNGDSGLNAPSAQRRCCEELANW